MGFGEAALGEEFCAVRDVVDRGETLVLLVAVGECAAEAAGAPHIRCEYRNAHVEQGREQFGVTGPGLTLRPTVQKHHGAQRLNATVRSVQPPGDGQTVPGGHRFQRRYRCDRTAAGPAVDALPLPRARIDEFDGARHVGALDRHRHHRSAGTDRQFTGDRIRQRDGLAQGTVGVLEDL